MRQVGRLFSLKDFDEPFYWNGNSFTSLNTGFKAPSNVRCDGDYYTEIRYVTELECKHDDEVLKQGDGFVYKNCAICGASI